MTVPAAPSKIAKSAIDHPLSDNQENLVWASLASGECGQDRSSLAEGDGDTGRKSGCFGPYLPLKTSHRAGVLMTRRQRGFTRFTRPAFPSL